MQEKIRSEFGVFQHSASILLSSFSASTIVFGRRRMECTQKYRRGGAKQSAKVTERLLAIRRQTDERTSREKYVSYVAIGLAAFLSRAVLYGGPTAPPEFGGGLGVQVIERGFWYGLRPPTSDV
jgi:hypothetical protein